MGLSASQARLLSITARLTDNEYHSQQIANAKMRLANASQEARDNYQHALNSTVLVYNGFDTEGNATQTTYTPNVMYYYQPLKNQYCILNTANQIVVTHKDAQNYEDTTNIIDFLDKYDVLDNYKGEYQQYQEDYQKYKEDLAQYEIDMDQWNFDNDKYQEYLKKYRQWQEEQKGNELYDLFATKIGTSNNPIAYCYGEALDGTGGCYLHLLNMMLDYDGTNTLYSHTYQATCDRNGNTGVPTCDVTTNTAQGGMFTSANFDVMKQVSDALNEQKNGTYSRLCDKDDDFHPDYENGGAPDTDKYNLIQAKIDAGEIPTPLDRLKSDWIYDPETNSVVGLKSLKQKAIDLYYMIVNGMISGATLKETLINFTEGDMKGISTPPPEIVPDPGDPPKKPKEPQPPEVKIKDREKAQWYANLWCRMNGNEDSPKIQTKEGLNELDDWYRKHILEDAKYIKNTFDKNYVELDMHLADSTTWLQDSLTQGILVMQRVNVDKLDGEHKYNWDEIIYSEASELTEEVDELAISRAEVAYEDKMREIEIKDKRYQLEINKLDSEHNALQTQVDAIRGEVSKNIERSFKTFS